MKRIDFLVTCEGELHRIIIAQNGHMRLCQHRQAQAELFAQREMMEKSEEDMPLCLIAFLHATENFISWQARDQLPTPLLMVLDITYTSWKTQRVWRTEDYFILKKKPFLNDGLGFRLLEKTRYYSAEVLHLGKQSVMVSGGVPIVTIHW